MTIMAVMLFLRLRLPQCGVSPLAAVGGSAVGVCYPMACHAMHRVILLHVLQLTAVVRSRLPGFPPVRPLLILLMRLQ